ncbi:cytochrome P450 [Acrocarpospora sp. B8E8]|uniref:cytochrome P450 n=1 Tax=Acrocarpospora sp. B8E8 TaxID=3153572 RepID=UPI00325CBC12
MHIDLVNQDQYARDGVPHDQMRWLRENAPVYWHQGDPVRDWPGFWALTKHADVVHVSRNSNLFSSFRRLALFNETPDETLELQRMMMLNQDPPEHTRRRSLVNRGFTPRAIAKLEERIREICHQLLDEAHGRSDVDFVRDISAPLPLYVICELLGAPIEDRDKIFEWSNRMIGSEDPDYATSPEEGQAAAFELYAYANELAAARREQPQDDIVTKLLQPDDSGETLAVDEFDLFVLLLVVAGNETTRNAASGGMLTFFEHPDEWRKLLKDPALARPASDEIVRWVSPVNLFRRTATTDMELRGQRIAENDKVVVFYSAANRDPEIFADPETFDITRDPNPQIGFGGGGAHFCLGNHLAKMELRVLFEILADRAPKIQQSGEATRLRSYFINGIKTLPVTL